MTAASALLKNEDLPTWVSDDHSCHIIWLARTTKLRILHAIHPDIFVQNTIILEKLNRSCPPCYRIYVLIPDLIHSPLLTDLSDHGKAKRVVPVDSHAQNP